MLKAFECSNVITNLLIGRRGHLDGVLSGRGRGQEPAHRRIHSGNNQSLAWVVQHTQIVQK